MELVFLWVENYKNIKNQGFNFSPRFRCKYNPDKNELTINENKDYIDIFPENINITAIVGKNGSGKSSLLNIKDNLLRNIEIIFYKNILYILIDKKCIINNKTNFKVREENIFNNEEIKLYFTWDVLKPLYWIVMIFYFL